ncbi:MAG TPA: TMEM14 family protein [Candidatus Polarisedimenticolia bacterium]|nr:TMEM14 family protein [Candidatus Polarisedimenticolia bacterium]
MSPAWVAFVYGAIVLAGGVMGFVKARSRASLIAGVASFALLLGAGALMLRGEKAGWIAAMAVAGLLLAFFAARWLKGRKFMPAGMMVLASAAALVLLAWGGR